jgi:glycolate oxidase iron-sulfur subunit
MLPVLGNRHVPSFPFQSFTEKHGGINRKARGGSPKVAFFPGCVPDKLLTGIAASALKVLEHYGAGVFMPDNLVCCGIPLIVSGDRPGYLRLMKENLQCLAEEKFDYLVTPCASCASTIVENWHRFRDYFSGADLKLIMQLHERSFEITSFLINVLKIDLSTPKICGKLPTVTYHDPCHLRKSLGIQKEPRAILAGLPKYGFAEMPEPERCCGNGGSFNVAHYDISKLIGKRKRDNIVSVNPQVVATTCPACMLQLMDMLSQNRDDIEVRHVVELYAESLDIGTIKEEKP